MFQEAVTGIDAKHTVSLKFTEVWTKPHFNLIIETAASAGCTFDTADKDFDLSETPDHSTTVFVKGSQTQLGTFRDVWLETLWLKYGKDGWLCPVSGQASSLARSIYQWL